MLFKLAPPSNTRKIQTWASYFYSLGNFVFDGDKPTQEEFFENLASAAKSLQKAIPKVLDYVCDHKNLDEKEEL